MKEEIMNRLAEAVKEKAGTGCDIGFRKTRKNNGVTLQGIAIRKHGETVSAVIYIDDLLDGIENAASAHRMQRKRLSVFLTRIRTGKSLPTVLSLLTKKRFWKKQYTS